MIVEQVKNTRRELKNKERFDAIYDRYGDCPVNVALGVIGGKWKPAILYMLDMGVNRFGDMQRMIPDVSKRMLTKTLRELESDGVISRKVFPQVPPKVVYSLTDKGRTLEPIYTAMEKWAVEHIFQHPQS